MTSHLIYSRLKSHLWNWNKGTVVDIAENELFPVFLFGKKNPRECNRKMQFRAIKSLVSRGTPARCGGVLPVSDDKYSIRDCRGGIRGFRSPFPPRIDRLINQTRITYVFRGEEKKLRKFFIPSDPKRIAAGRDLSRRKKNGGPQKMIKTKGAALIFHIKNMASSLPT